MPLIPLQIPKGQYRNGTEYMSQGRWRDGNLVRWHDDALRPVGGWRARIQNDGTEVDIHDAPSTPTVAGPARGAHAWVDNAGNRYAAFGTYNGLVAMLESSVLDNLTPTSGFTDGRIDATLNTGWGAGGWGYQAWGVARQDIGSIQTATTWSLDNWGEYLIACSSDDGQIYEWDLDAATASVVSNAPTGCSAAFVTEERFLVALGCDDAGVNNRRIAWSDQENNTSWTATATNQAGDIELQTNGQILAGVRTRGQSLILTDQDAHSMTYQGPPFVYGFQRVGTSCGMIAAGAYASVDAGVIWMGNRGFFIYSGGAVRDLPCEVSDYVFSDMNVDQKSKIQAVVNSQWNEVWWLYQSNDSDECDGYVAFDYAENIWMTGKIDRTTGFDRGVFRNPMMVASGGTVYEHEVGSDYGTTAPFCETGPIAIGSGDRLMKVTKMIRDEKTQGDVRFDFKTRLYPNSEETSHGPYPSDFKYDTDYSVDPATLGAQQPPYVTDEDKNKYDAPTSVRFQGRQVRMKVSGQTADWRVGVIRLEAREGSRR